MRPQLCIAVPIFGDYVEQYSSSLIPQLFLASSNYGIEVIILTDSKGINYLTSYFSEYLNNLFLYPINILLKSPEDILCNCRNIGIEKATAHNIIFIDADDNLLTSNINLILQYLFSIESNVIDIIIIDYLNQTSREYSHSSENSHELNLPFGESKLISDYDCKNLDINGFHPFLYRTIYRISFLRKHNIKFFSYIISEDNEFFARAILKSNNISLLSIPLISRVLSSTSISSIHLISQKYSYEKVIISIFNCINELYQFNLEFENSHSRITFKILLSLFKMIIFAYIYKLLLLDRDNLIEDQSLDSIALISSSNLYSNIKVDDNNIFDSFQLFNKLTLKSYIQFENSFHKILESMGIDLHSKIALYGKGQTSLAVQHLLFKLGYYNIYITDSSSIKLDSKNIRELDKINDSRFNYFSIFIICISYASVSKKISKELSVFYNNKIITIEDLVESAILI